MYKRILLKISGSYFGGENEQGLNFNSIKLIADEITRLHNQGIQIAIVNGAGNIFRGRTRPEKFDVVAADKLGFISTLPNSMALNEVLNSQGIKSHLMCAFSIPSIARHFDAFKARELLSNNKILVITGGTGHPFFTTDTTAVLRALEIQADILLKATDVDGVYSDDPALNPNAIKFTTLTYQEALDNRLQIMDQTAFALAKDNNLKILVFKFEKGALNKIITDNSSGTIISN